MKVLVVGAGGREHAIVWKLEKSPKVSKIYCAPGNGGIGTIAQCVNIDVKDIDGIVNFSRENSMDLVVVAPDDPLALGMVDALENAGIKAFGPSKAAARLESSKIFAKEFMKKYNIPTGSYEVFYNYDKALSYIRSSAYPLVIKADGLALGKGVIIAQNLQEAEKALDDMMVHKIFGAAGEKIIVEEFLEGPEVSILAFTDGKDVIPMVSCQDHKEAYDGGRGPNTGGMGVFSPSKYYTKNIEKIVNEEMLIPTIKAMAKEGHPFKGVLFLGLMLTEKGPKLLEYNARFGDPETQAVLPRLKTDLMDIFLEVVDENLRDIDIEWEDNASVCVIMASGGYPGPYKTGYLIHGIGNIEDEGDITLFHSGTKMVDGKFETAGGRVLGLTALADDLEEAVKKAYKGVSKLEFNDIHYRRDIGIDIK